EALAASPKRAAIWANRAVALGDLDRHDESLASYEKAVALGSVPYVLGDWLRAKMQVCHWDGFDGACRRTLAAVDAGEKAASPFSLLAIDSSPAQQRRCAAIYINDLYPGSPYKSLPAKKHKRIRLGYFSRDFRNNAL